MDDQGRPGVKVPRVWWEQRESRAPLPLLAPLCMERRERGVIQAALDHLDSQVQQEGTALQDYKDRRGSLRQLGKGGHRALLVLMAPSGRGGTPAYPVLKEEQGRREFPVCLGVPAGQAPHPPQGSPWCGIARLQPYPSAQAVRPNCGTDTAC